MKLSEVKGERVFDVIASLIDPVANIATSDEFREVTKPKKCPDGVEPSEFMAGRIKECVPSFIRSHKDDVVAILSTIAGIDPEDYEKDMTIMSLWSDVMELLGDEDFVAFLSSAQAMMGGLRST